MGAARKGERATTVETRRVFPPGYKREAVRLTLVGDRSVRAVAQDLGVDPNVLYQWKRQALTRVQERMTRATPCTLGASPVAANSACTRGLP